MPYQPPPSSECPGCGHTWHALPCEHKDVVRIPTGLSWNYCTCEGAA